jgi:hypothetical protein
MKQLLLAPVLASALALVFAAAAAGCGKASDLRPLKEETTGMVSNYAERLAALEQRKQDLSRRGSAFLQTEEARPVKAQLDEVTGVILPGMQVAVRTAPARIDAVEKDAKLDEQKKVAALRAFAAETEERLADGWLLASAKLDAVEVWVNRAAAQTAPQTAPPQPGTASPMPAPPQPGAGDAASAAGGTYPAGQPQQGSAADNAAR